MPVIIPATLLVFLTGAVRTYTFLTELPETNKTGTARRPSFTKGFNATEETFSQYASVLAKLNPNGPEMPSRSDEETALELLNHLVHQPISMEGDTFREAKLSHFAPQTLLLSISQSLAKRAQISAENGDFVMARKYVDALYGIGDHVLSASSLSLQGLESAHHFLGFATHVQVSVFGKGDYHSAARYREWALTTLWKQQISPRLKGNHFAPHSQNDKVLAASLAQEYRDGWSRIRAGEA
ncbi:MAG: hypothetical protein H7145_05360 [Akkermansiaceae bacterium]|nr:hypothetical protein [Armatimonadota bacterium]